MINKIPFLQPFNQEEPNSDTLDYKSWREQFILTILRIASILGVALIASSYSTATITDRILYIALYIILLLVTLLRIKYVVRTFALLFMLFAIGLNSILAWGPWLDGSIFFIAFITLAAILFDERVDIVALSVSIFTFALIGILQQLGSYQFRAPNAPV